VKLNCHEIEELIAAYLADQLSVHERFRVEMHLNHCTSCSEEIADLELTFNAVNQEFGDESQFPALDSDRRAELMSVWNQTAHRPKKRMVPFRKVFTSLAAAAAVILAVYLRPVSDVPQVEIETSSVEVAILPPTIIPLFPVGTKAASTPSYEAEYGGFPLPEIVQSEDNELPEYGMGSLVFASQSKVAPSWIPRYNLRMPSVNYDFDDRRGPGYE
jgi:hypothetical protein